MFSTILSLNTLNPLGNSEANLAVVFLDLRLHKVCFQQELLVFCYLSDTL